MTFAQFCIACGANPKWVQNTARNLGWSLRYTAEEARHVGLVKQLQRDLHLPLKIGDRRASETLRNGAVSHGTAESASTARITVDVDRYLSDFAFRLARALSHQPRRRGRPDRQGVSAVTRARRYGLDIGLLESSLRSTPEDRILRLEENMEFTRALRARP